MTMTDTEAKALALVNEFRAKCTAPTPPVTMSHVWAYGAAWKALCRVIEREEATEARYAAEMRELKERFSEVAKAVLHQMRANQLMQAHVSPLLAPFILPAPDPLDAVAAYFKADRAEVERLFAENGLAVRKIGEAGE